MSGAVIIQQANGQDLDLSAMIQSAVAQTVTELETQRRTQSKRGRSDQGSGHPVLAKILTNYRTFGGMTQAELARKAGVHPTTISKIEDGERGISMQTLSKLSVPLGMLFAGQVLRYYREGPDDFTEYRTDGNNGRGPRGETGGPVEEHSVSKLGSVAATATSRDEASGGTR